MIDIQWNLEIMDTLGRIILSIIERLSSFRGKKVLTLVHWKVSFKCPLPFIRGSVIRVLWFLRHSTSSHILFQSYTWF